VEIANEVGAMGKMGEREPLSVGGRVTKEVHKVLKLAAEVPRIQDGVHFELRIAVDVDGRRGRDGTIGERIGAVGGKEGNVKDRVDLHGGGQGKSIGMGGDAVGDGEGTKAAVVKLARGTIGGEGEASEPYWVTDVEGREGARAGVIELSRSSLGVKKGSGSRGVDGAEMLGELSSGGDRRGEW